MKEVEIMKSNCLICKKEFEKTKKTQNRIYCNSCSPKEDTGNNVMKSNKKELYVSLMGGSCTVCGYDKSYKAIDFHHIDPSTKEISLGNTATTLIKELNELTKCAILCSNCHREYHAGVITELPAQDYTALIEHIDFVNLTRGIKCSCGNSKLKASKECVTCSQKSQRKVERPSKEILEHEIYQHSFRALGIKYGVIDNTIRKWCKGYGLPYRKKDMKV